jgi:hypothetical protein
MSWRGGAGSSASCGMSGGTTPVHIAVLWTFLRQTCASQRARSLPAA